MLWFILKAGLGAALFVLILWFAQSRHPRVAGMMLTFPTLNGIGLLAGDRGELHHMASAMVPMIATNGLICAGYIGLQHARRSPGAQSHPALRLAYGLGACLLLWFGIALLVAPHLQAWLTFPNTIPVFVLGYIVCVSPLVWLLWCPAQAPAGKRLGLRHVLRANWERVAGLLALILLVMAFIRMGADTWAGRFSAFPLLPLYTLAMLYADESATRQDAAMLRQIGSTVLLGPIVAILFVWGFVHYLSSLSHYTQGAVYLGGGVLGLLAGWGTAGMLMWGMLRVMSIIESRAANWSQEE